MGFKLGKGKAPIASQGEITTKMRFGKESGDADASVPGTPVIRKSLDPGIMGEANMDGSIFISDQLIPGTFEERQVINHEMRHATDMKVGKLSYTDDYIMYNGDRFDRETINGRDMIRVDGQWKEAGDTGFPWEDDANNGEETAI
tara:strand:- start:2138 stop:2572 length:435 start_codon:yes stop_codon:yes gene_type:complete